MTTWNDLGALSKVAITAMAFSILFLIIPPLSVVCALVSIVSSGTSLMRSRRGDFRTVDVVSLGVSVLVIATIVIGTIVYGIANAN